MTDRTPHDGKPYYCRECGSGFSEFMACEEPDCKLEDRRTAMQRQWDKGDHQTTLGIPHE